MKREREGRKWREPLRSKCQMLGEGLTGGGRSLDGEGGGEKVGEAWKKKKKKKEGSRGEMKVRVTVWCIGREGIHRHGRMRGMGERLGADA